MEGVGGGGAFEARLFVVVVVVVMVLVVEEIKIAVDGMRRLERTMRVITTTFYEDVLRMAVDNWEITSSMAVSTQSIPKCATHHHGPSIQSTVFSILRRQTVCR